MPTRHIDDVQDWNRETLDPSTEYNHAVREVAGKLKQRELNPPSAAHDEADARGDTVNGVNRPFRPRRIIPPDQP